jgi:uncharacterized protein YigA (DUF484 family)
MPRPRTRGTKLKSFRGVASVVIAAVGLLINFTIQRAQIKSSEENTRAQVQVAKQNNEAQLLLNERTADVQKHIQESTLTGQLVEHLASTSPLKKQLAIVALRSSIPTEMYNEVISIVIRSETNPQVRITALGQAATLSGAEAGVVQAIAEVASSSGSSEERHIATTAIGQLGVRSLKPGDTFVLSATTGAELATDPSVFTRSLVQGLLGAASNKDGSIQLTGLEFCVRRSVEVATLGRQHPMLTGPKDGGDPTILGLGAKFKNTIVVAIGNSNYQNQMPRLQFAALDAEAFAEVFHRQGADVQVVADANRETFFHAFDSAMRKTDADSLLIFCYAGHGYLDSKGEFWLLQIDTDPDRLMRSAISTEELRQALAVSPARTKILFLDASFAGRFAMTGQ